MAKWCFVLLCVVSVFAEPPPPSYLPPQARNSPSSQYGAPQQQFGAQRSGGIGGQGNGRSFSYNSLAESQFGGSSRSSSRGRLGAQSRQQQPSQQYGAPNSRQPSQQYGAPSFDDSVVVNARASQGRRNGGFAAPAPRSFGAQPASQYNAPAPQYSAPRQQQSSYAAAARQQPSAQYGAPSTEYGAPFGRSNMDDDLAEPANYEYNYEVNAAEEAGPEFGHQETREDDFAQGEYHVLLPDGRMQIVEYEADEEGFRPKIRYEESGGYPESRANQGPY